MLIFYFFALIGMYLFGGKVMKGSDVFSDNPDIASNWWQVNFNDFFSAIITLWTLMVVNNWMITMKMFTKAMGSNWYRLYFYVFFYLSSVIGMNLVVAYILDMYSSVERIADERDITMQILKDRLAEVEDEKKEMEQKYKIHMNRSLE